jgi:hypothetical protein
MVKLIFEAYYKKSTVFLFPAKRRRESRTLLRRWKTKPPELRNKA